MAGARLLQRGPYQTIGVRVKTQRVFTLTPIVTAGRRTIRKTKQGQSQTDLKAPVCAFCSGSVLS